ncbi:MAG: DinB family protein [Acidobacteria bacterium]|nr:DinB family protein [Acidobacteriota bacterium]
MNNDAAGLHAQISAVREDAAKLLTGLTESNFNWRPDPNHWSIAQCFDHLNVLGFLYLPQLSEKIAKSSSLSGEQNYRLGFIGKFFVRSMEPPVKSKFKAPKSFIPAPEKSLVTVAPEFMKLQDLLEDQINAAENVNWARVKVVSPASKLIRLNLTEALAIIVAHERRHLWQAWQVRKNPNFPD